MDSKIFDMLEHYKQVNKTEKIFKEKDNFKSDFCLDTDYTAKSPEILTMVFVNMQPIDNVYETEEGFTRGTIFPNIDKPFLGCKKT